MTMQVLGYAVRSAKDALAPYSFVHRDPRPSDKFVLKIPDGLL